MTSLFRLVRKPFSATPFDGEGSFLFGGRWSRPGVRVVYTAEHLSLAMIEYLAHLDASNPPQDLMLARAEVPDGLERSWLRVEDLPADWRSFPAPDSLAAYGEDFVYQQKAAILIVPSAIATTDHNWILNPAHQDFPAIVLHEAVPFTYDTPGSFGKTDQSYCGPLTTRRSFSLGLRHTAVSASQ